MTLLGEWAAVMAGQAADDTGGAAGRSLRERSATGWEFGETGRTIWGQGRIRPARIAATRDGRLQDGHGLRTSADISGTRGKPYRSTRIRSGR